jgi:hypothetical protein
MMSQKLNDKDFEFFFSLEISKEKYKKDHFLKNGDGARESTRCSDG